MDEFSPTVSVVCILQRATIAYSYFDIDCAMLTTEQLQHFSTNGYLIMPALADSEYCASVITLAEQALREETGPIEYEADTRYPGAPASRFKHAHAQLFLRWHDAPIE